MTRRGKIARLPKEIRATLNERLANGERNDLLVEWLNAQKEVQEILAVQFAGRAITEQNLSEWKGGGFKDWERTEISKDLVRGCKEASDDLDDAALGAEISDCSARLLSAEILSLQREMLDKTMDVQERWKLVCQLHKQISKMRKDDHRSVRTILRQEKWEQEQEDRDELRDRQELEDFKKLEAEREKRINAPLLAQYDVPSLAKMYGGGARGWQRAARRIELARGLPPGILQKRKGGEWRVKEGEWTWVPDEAKKTKHPTSNIQQPTSNENGKEAGGLKIENGKQSKKVSPRRHKGRKGNQGLTESRPTDEHALESAETQLNPGQSDLIQAKNLAEGGDIADCQLPIADLKSAPTDSAGWDGYENGKPPEGGTPNGEHPTSNLQ